MEFIDEIKGRQAATAASIVKASLPAMRRDFWAQKVADSEESPAEKRAALVAAYERNVAAKAALGYGR